jgi:hypothetical protein
MKMGDGIFPREACRNTQKGAYTVRCVPYLFGFRPGMDILGDVEAGFTIFRISWRISTIFSMGLHELPTYLKSFRQAHPQVDDLEQILR